MRVPFLNLTPFSRRCANPHLSRWHGAVFPYKKISRVGVSKSRRFGQRVVVDTGRREPMRE
jgi:hypothetical protein